MKKQMKKVLSVLLVIVMTLSMGSVLNDSAFAADGDYYKSCSMCGATGKVYCSECKGLGFKNCLKKWEIEPNNKCGNCNGMGHIYSDVSNFNMCDCEGSGKCTECHGSGICSQCDGNDANCYYCKGSGKCSDCYLYDGSSLCFTCKGVGVSDDKEYFCETCNGKGYVGENDGTYCLACGGDFMIDCSGGCDNGKVTCTTCSGNGAFTYKMGEYTLVLDGGKTYASLDGGSTSDGEVSISGLTYASDHWTMNNFTFDVDGDGESDCCGNAIQINGNTEIEIKGVNSISNAINSGDIEVCGIKVNGGTVTFSGDGSLEVAVGGDSDSGAFLSNCVLSNTQEIIASISSNGTGANSAGITINSPTRSFSFGGTKYASDLPKYVKIQPISHTHTWSYTSNNGTLTATCTCDNSNDSCSYKGKTGANRQVSLTLSADDEEYTGEEYDGTSISDSTAWENAGLTVPTIKYVGRQTTSYTESETAPTAIGTYTAKISASTTNATVDFEIEKAIVTVSGTTVANKTYDGTTTATVTPGILQGIIGSETVTLLNTTGAFEDKNVGDSKDVTVTYTLTGDDSGNYDVEAETLNADISPKVLSVTGTTVSDKFYDGTAAADVYSGAASGIISGDNIVVSATGAFDDKNVGEGKEVTVTYTLTGDDAQNYTVMQDTSQASILQKKIVVKNTVVENKEYDGTINATITLGSLLGVATGDNVTVTATGTFDDKNVGNNKNVTVSYTLTGADIGNYTIDSEELSADINKKNLILIECSVANKTYDATTDATISYVNLDGVVDGENVTLVSVTAAFIDKNIGIDKNVRVSYTLDGVDKENYEVNTTTLRATIMPKTITVTGSNIADKFYDGTADATVNIGNILGIISGENVTVSATGTFEDENVGDGKKVFVHYTILGEDAGNYSIKDEDIVGNIKAAPLFDDCLGGNITVDNYTEYVKGEVPTVDCYAKTQGYIFNGWFYRGIGFSFNELDGEPIDGTQYFAEWLNNGKTVTTYRLILDEMCNTDNLSKYGWQWDMDNKVLTLNNATIDCTGMNIDEDYCAVYSENSFILNVTGDNTIISGKTFGDSNRSSGLASGEDLTIEGNGKLLVISGESEYASLGLETAGDLIVKSGVDLTVKSRNASLVTNGINLQGDLEIENGATVNAYSKDSSEEYYAVWVKGNVNVNGTLNLYGACKIGTETKEAMYLESESGVLNISETGKITSDGVIKTDNENGFGNKTDKCYTVKNCVVNNTELQLVGMVIQHNMVAIRDTDITQTGVVSALIGQTSVKPIKNKRMEITLTKYEVDVNGTNYETYGYLDSSDAAFNTPNKKEHIFVGWFKDEIYASAWNFVTDCVRSNNIKIYPGFVKNDIEVTSNIPGRVRDTNVVGVADAIVELYKGRNKLAATVTDSNGDFVFNNVAYGIYNIVVIKDDNKTTQIYKVPDEPAEIVMPNVNTILEANDTGAVVDGMLNVVADNADVVKLVLEDKEEDKADPIQKAITKIASDKKIEYVEATLFKNNSDIGNDNNAVITIIMPYDTTRKDIAVYRYHVNKAEKLTKVNSKMETPEDGNYNIDKENNLIYIYASKFSTYAVGYTNEENSNKESKTTTYTSVISSKSKKKIKNNFEDVSKEVYYYEPVNWAVENNVTAGIDETHFGPKVITTRAQMITFLWKLAGSPEPTIRECKFTDVVSGSYYEKAVLWAVENGITHGTTETTFSPKENVKRGQAVTLIHNYKGNKVVSGENKFNDVKENAYYYNSVIWAVENGITSGTTENTFSPNENCTRAQVVTFLYNCSK